MCASSHQANQTCGRCFSMQYADSSSDNINKLRAQRSARQYLFQLSESLSYLDKNHYFYSNRFNVLTLSTVHLATQLIDWNTTFELWAIVCIYFLNKCWTGRNMNLEKGSAIVHVASLELRESLSSKTGSSLSAKKVTLRFYSPGWDPVESTEMNCCHLLVSL